MNEKQFIKLYGKRKFNKFKKWMFGQTCGIDENGESNYYDWDVTRFINGMHPMEH